MRASERGKKEEGHAVVGKNKEQCCSIVHSQPCRNEPLPGAILFFLRQGGAFCFEREPLCGIELKAES